MLSKKKKRTFWADRLLQGQDREGECQFQFHPTELCHGWLFCLRLVWEDGATTTSLAQLIGETLPHVLFKNVVSIICISFDKERLVPREPAYLCCWCCDATVALYWCTWCKKYKGHFFAVSYLHCESAEAQTIFRENYWHKQNASVWPFFIIHVCVCVCLCGWKHHLQVCVTATHKINLTLQLVRLIYQLDRISKESLISLVSLQTFFCSVSELHQHTQHTHKNRSAKDEASSQRRREKTGSIWKIFFFAAIWPWNEGTVEAIITTRGG